MSSVLNKPVRVVLDSIEDGAQLSLEPGAFLAVTVTVAAGQQLSTTAGLQGYMLGAVETPSALSSNTLRFRVSRDGTTFIPYRENGTTRVQIAVATNEAASYVLPTTAFPYCYRYWKLDCVTTEASNRTFVLVARMV